MQVQRKAQQHVQVMFRLPPPLGAALKQIAEADSRTLASLIRKLAADCVENERRRRAAVPELTDDIASVR